MTNINCVWENIMNLYKACITIKEVGPYSSTCSKAFLVCRGEDEIMTFKNAVSLDKDIDSKERWQSDCLICLNAEGSM